MIVCIDDHLLLSIKWGYRNKQPIFTGFWKGSMRLNLVGIETKKLDIKQIISIWSAMRSQCRGGRQDKARARSEGFASIISCHTSSSNHSSYHLLCCSRDPCGLGVQTKPKHHRMHAKNARNQ